MSDFTADGGEADISRTVAPSPSGRSALAPSPCPGRPRGIAYERLRLLRPLSTELGLARVRHQKCAGRAGPTCVGGGSGEGLYGYKPRRAASNRGRDEETASRGRTKKLTVDNQPGLKCRPSARLNHEPQLKLRDPLTRLASLATLSPAGEEPNAIALRAAP